MDDEILSSRVTMKNVSLWIIPIQRSYWSNYDCWVILWWVITQMLHHFTWMVHFFKSLECQFCFEKINYRISSKFRSWFKGDNRAQLFQNPQKWVNQWSWFSGQMVVVQHAVILDVNQGYHTIYASLEGQMGLIVKDFRKNRLTKPKRKYLNYKAYMKNKLINSQNFGKLTPHIQCFPES